MRERVVAPVGALALAGCNTLAGLGGNEPRQPQLAAATCRAAVAAAESARPAAATQSET